jgi:hypothetical protein
MESKGTATPNMEIAEISSEHTVASALDGLDLPALAPHQVAPPPTTSDFRQDATSETPAPKRRKHESAISIASPTESVHATLKTPDIASESSRKDFKTEDLSFEESPFRGPVRQVDRMHSSGSVSSDMSSASAGTERHKNLSPVPTAFASEVPPAPPSTPASNTSMLPWDAGAATPLPIRQDVFNASVLEEQQLLAEGAATPAPTNAPRTTSGNGPTLPDDFSDWAVGDRYDLLRMLGRGSYGEVAQAIDLYAGRADAFVAIKRILSPFDQEVDAVRLYREIHILRRMRGHDCIIQLLDVVQPPTDDLDDFHDLYLVFEYVDTDLYKLIMSPQYLTTEHIQTFLYQMLTGLKFIHSFSVIHR